MANYSIRALKELRTRMLVLQQQVIELSAKAKLETNPEERQKLEARHQIAEASYKVIYNQYQNA